METSLFFEGRLFKHVSYELNLPDLTKSSCVHLLRNNPAGIDYIQRSCVDCKTLSLR